MLVVLDKIISTDCVSGGKFKFPLEWYFHFVNWTTHPQNRNAHKSQQSCDVSTEKISFESGLLHGLEQHKLFVCLHASDMKHQQGLHTEQSLT